MRTLGILAALLVGGSAMAQGGAIGPCCNGCQWNGAVFTCGGQVVGPISLPDGGILLSDGQETFSFVPSPGAPANLQITTQGAELWPDSGAFIGEVSGIPLFPGPGHFLYEQAPDGVFEGDDAGNFCEQGSGGVFCVSAEEDSYSLGYGSGFNFGSFTGDYVEGDYGLYMQAGGPIGPNTGSSIALEAFFGAWGGPVDGGQITVVLSDDTEVAIFSPNSGTGADVEILANESGPNRTYLGSFNGDMLAIGDPSLTLHRSANIWQGSAAFQGAVDPGSVDYPDGGPITCGSALVQMGALAVKAGATPHLCICNGSAWCSLAISTGATVNCVGGSATVCP